MGNSEARKKAAVARHEQIRAKAPRRLHGGSGPPRFIADVMLGRLAKWLRIAGFDVLYSNSYTDDELIALSNSEERILLSLDTRLLIRRPVKQFIFLESQNVQDQIRQILRATHTKHLNRLLSRCLTCNTALIETSRESVRDLVPSYVYKTQSRFKSCPRCQKIFWAGTHRQSVYYTLEKLLHQSAEIDS